MRAEIEMPATVRGSPEQIAVTFHRRAHLPIILASEIFKETPSVPWWHGASLVLRSEPKS